MLAVAAGVWVASLGVAVAQETAVDFNRDIRPIFNAHCTSCHGGVKQAADVSFVYANQVVAPDGWIVEPGEPDDSILLDRVRSDDPLEVMPPPEHGPPLSKNEIALLERWIRQGAKWGNHWAFEKLQAPASPTTKTKGWNRSSIDPFVLSRLEQENIKPAGDSPPERWLRRVTLDLTGLPPTLKQRKLFLDQVSKSKTDRETNVVYQKTVDRLLKSPAYGERWASVWLDQVRYADSKGLGVDGRRNIWKYRDWVIDALNRDLPYDEFTIKQIAGDLLPKPQIEDHIATAAHRLTQTNEEGGTDDEEFRVAAVLDRVNTTWQAWQGVTFGCAQCHSHPYDPIEHHEYYQFAAFFNNTADSDLNEDWPAVKAPINVKDYSRASKLDQQIEDLNNAIWQREYEVLANDKNWQPLQGLKAKTNNKTQVVVKPQTHHDEFHTVDTVSKGTTFDLEAPLPDNLKRLTSIRLTVMPLDPDKAATDSEWGFSLSGVKVNLIAPDSKKPQPIKISRLIVDEPTPFYDPQQSLNPKSGQGFSAYTRIFKPRSAALVLESPVDVPQGAKLQVSLRHKVYILSAFPLVIKRGHLAVSDSKEFSKLRDNRGLNRKRAALAKAEKERAAIKSTSVPVLKERPQHLTRPQHVFIRGLFLTKDKQVTADTPDLFAPLPAEKTPGKKSDRPQPSRLALARWMVSSENPLTARVAVNRVWARLFGVGIVATEEDFGSSGELPSHPQLLDHLAFQFQNDFAWSQKKLIREIVLSSVYRQSSTIRADLQQQDASNRLLGRGPRHRLASEIVRDQALAISGLLSKKQFGPPVHPPIPAGVWKPFQGGDKWKTPKPDSEDRYRRSIYTYTKRSIPFPMASALDAPSREFCAPRRLRSNTPIQALMLLNDQTMIECADSFSKKIRDSAKDTNAQLRNGFVMATCREPADSEVDQLLALLQTYGQDEQAGLRSVAMVLLNLDEALTK